MCIRDRGKNGALDRLGHVKLTLAQLVAAQFVGQRAVCPKQRGEIARRQCGQRSLRVRIVVCRRQMDCVVDKGIV